MRKTVVPILFLALAFPFFGVAQIPPGTVVADITFDFIVGNEVLPAGTYKFNHGVKAGVVAVTNAKSSQSIMAMVLTRISQYPGNDARVVFDKMGDQYYLSELHAPGIDGFHFSGAPGPHSHVGIKASK